MNTSNIQQLHTTVHNYKLFIKQNIVVVTDRRLQMPNWYECQMSVIENSEKHI
jgi:hypothetical protein